MPLILIEKEHLLDNIWAFRFKPTEPFHWTAGQYVSVELPHDHPDGEGTKRWFTISSAPYEKVIQITTRITESSFKQALSKLTPGDELQLLDLPHGDFIWRDIGKPLVFVAGGIGVTPIRSILKQRVHDGLPLTATVIYGSRTPDIPFREELQEWMKADSRLKVHFLVGSPLTIENLNQLVPELHESFIYLSGPRPVMETLQNDLLVQGVSDLQLTHDFFPAYTKNNY